MQGCQHVEILNCIPESEELCGCVCEREKETKTERLRKMDSFTAMYLLHVLSSSPPLLLSSM